MLTKQISLFIENKKGRLGEVTSILKRANVNIKAFSLLDTNNFGVFRFIADNINNAKKALQKENFTTGITFVLCVLIKDKQGGLNKILRLIDESKINIEYMYPFVKSKGDNSIIVFRFDDNEKALKIFKKNNIKIVKE